MATFTVSDLSSETGSALALVAAAEANERCDRVAAELAARSTA